MAVFTNSIIPSTNTGSQSVEAGTTVTNTSHVRPQNQSQPAP